jgi:hypothetical protein
MKSIIELYKFKLEHRIMTDDEIDRYEHLIKLYMDKMKTRLEIKTSWMMEVKDDNR